METNKKQKFSKNKKSFATVKVSYTIQDIQELCTRISSPRVRLEIIAPEPWYALAKIYVDDNNKPIASLTTNHKIYTTSFNTPRSINIQTLETLILSQIA